MSSERSGSNLLRVMLGAHAALCAPPAVHFTTHLAPLTGLYGSLDDPAAVRELAGDLVALTRSHLAPWSGDHDADAVVQRVRQPTFWAVADALFRAEAEHAGKTGWVCKDNRLWEHAAEISLQLRGVRVIYLFRDGRDVAASFRRAPAGPKTVLAAAGLWASEQRAAMRIAAGLGAYCHRVAYEQLTVDPEPTLRDLCAWLQIDYDPAMLDYHQQDKTRELASRSDFWTNLARPVIADNTGRYREVYSPGQLRLFERIAGGELASLGYPLEHPPQDYRPAGAVRRAADVAMDVASRWWARRRAREQGDRSIKRNAVRDIQRRLRRRAMDAHHTPDK